MEKEKAERIIRFIDYVRFIIIVLFLTLAFVALG